MHLPARVYTVMPGDTLYSVAWESGRDYRQLARWNHLSPPYVLVMGERLRLVAPPRPAVSATPGAGTAAPDGRPLVARPLRPSPRVSPSMPVTPPANVSRPAPVVQPVVSVPREPAPRRRSAPRPVRSWIWPAEGRVISGYGGPSGNRGIDIAGNYGEPVRASASGRVVYIGSGLPGYGRLIIIKDNNDYLSAYAHNAHMYVEEGGRVRQGQTIATMGESGTDHVELHFEIRRQGNPVNPLLFLPHVFH